MSQPNHHSLAEAVANTASGLVISFMLAAWMFPLMGITIDSAQNATLTVVFTVVSLIRSYVFRRMFNHLHTQGWWQ